ncbi:MAG: ABC transporter substrate-binding protein [Bryobacteraceae bacterium]
MLRRTFLTASALAAAGGLVSCARRAPKEPRMKLRVSAANHFSMCPFYVAYESGYFSDAGFDVELAKDIGMAQSLPLLAGGKLDAGLTGLGPSVVNAVIRGARVRLVAARERVSPSCGTAGTIFLSRKVFPHGVQSVRQLRGARIAITETSPRSRYWLDLLLRQGGMRLSDVVVRKISLNEKVAALHAGAIDGFVTSEADLDPELRPLGLVAGPSVARLEQDVQFSYILFGSRLLDGRVETGARFLHAYFRGASDFVGGKTPRFLDDFAKKNNLDATALRQGCRATSERDGSIHLDDLRQFVQWMAAQDLCPANVDAAALVDTRFLEASRSMK